MPRVLALALTAVLVVFGLTPPLPARAQATVEYTTRLNTYTPPETFTLQGVYWATSAQLTTVAPGAGTLETWNTPLVGLDFRADTRSHWGLHLNGVTGSQGSWTFLGASPAGLSLSGTDTIWSADISYAFTQREAEHPLLTTSLRLFAGYGSASASTTVGNLAPLGQALGIGPGSATVTTTSTGLRVGFDFTYPFEGGWSLNAGLAYSPSLNTTATLLVQGVGTASASVGGTAWDGAASVRYTAPGHWNVELGYRWVQENQGTLSIAGVSVCPCQTQWQGPYLAVGLTF